ncbi:MULTISPECIES: CDP-diacylglycerol--glycerol-3-phosphate 3-phosphatidyltransferase [Olsenella]|uniref:CDP-diacylglycerol--glycerol-3-phosphate 3-phosphatidyltransferase n=1 Tax=Olsenella TaxID=133925 RepID=UPI000231F1E5|nr:MULTISPECIES: CDP-diacylglycerol--glycerol-3-phosphate 3-phosphatidyltransferase [Olsenella]EHF01851.1 CDP-diacylglycerol-glycerol-3-phosphate 3-phosphatidyltransferase [Olsenella sp. oral taxon 809 str. F0356]
MSKGKKSIWTPANVVTCARVVLVPVWLLVAELSRDWGAAPNHYEGALVVAVFYILLSLTDKLDGHLARSRGEVTTFGKFLDPIADKLVVVVSLCYLLEAQMVSPWVLLVVVAREFLVSGLRMVVASKGVVIAASSLGKWKTATTMVSISGLLLLRAIPISGVAFVVSAVSFALLWVAVVLTAWSGVDYFAKSWKYITEDADD